MRFILIMEVLFLFVVFLGGSSEIVFEVEILVSEVVGTIRNVLLY